MPEGIQQIDFIILNFVRENLNGPILDMIAPFVSLPADNGIIWIVVTLALLFSKRYRKNGLTLSLALALEFILCNLILKPLVHRVRPYDLNPVPLLINTLSDYSFPSGHTSASFTAATVLYSINKKWGAAAYFLAAAIGFSRIYLYVHFPSDVLAGALLGLLCGAVALRLDGAVTMK